MPICLFRPAYETPYETIAIPNLNAVLVTQEIGSDLQSGSIRLANDEVAVDDMTFFIELEEAVVRHQSTIHFPREAAA
jgi:hypothetical protein